MYSKSAIRMTTISLLMLCLRTSAATAQEADVATLLSKDLAANQSKEVSMNIVSYAPGGSDPAHRDDAQAFVTCWRAPL